MFFSPGRVSDTVEKVKLGFQNVFFGVKIALYKLIFHPYSLNDCKQKGLEDNMHLPQLVENMFFVWPSSFFKSCHQTLTGCQRQLIPSLLWTYSHENIFLCTNLDTRKNKEK